MKYFKRFLLMLQFLTAIPLPIKLNVQQEDFGKGLVFAPVVGLVLGGVLMGSYYGLRILFPQYQTAVFIVILYILLTGGLHLDGLGDTFDGVFSNRSKEKILEIMRDSRVGTNAVLAVVSILLVNSALLAGMGQAEAPKIILLMPVAGRIGSLISTGVSNYARSGEGLGKSFIDYCGVREIAVGLPIYGVIFFAAAGTAGLMLAAVPVVSAYFLVKMLGRKIGGATGDILGAVCELNQTIFLVAAFIFLTLGYRL
ncbi:MAG: adenosylcobinamide-GDP ribazoletransferase [Clostridiales bacterium]|nr:adenosylcobinamide-GDP ribazoletransferase [Eubacteriales bacterium]MDH7565544.1 adenosylcobinamide-GDP ribazoletransferase [Clostridiales bacterium]